MRTTIGALALMAAAASIMSAAPAMAQGLPGQQKVFQGAGTFTNSRVYMGPVVGYVDASINSPFTFTYTYYNFMGSDTILPGSVRISAPTLFANDVSFTGLVGMTMPDQTSYEITLNNPSTIEYLNLDLDLANPVPAGGGPVALLPTSTINFSGRRFQYTGNVTAFLIGTGAAAVPEASTWVMVMAGVGVAGGALRRRKRIVTRVRFV